MVEDPVEEVEQIVDEGHVGAGGLGLENERNAKRGACIRRLGFPSSSFGLRRVHLACRKMADNI